MGHHPLTFRILKDCFSPCLEPPAIRHPTIRSQRQNHKHHWSSRERKLPTGWSYAENKFHSHCRPLGSRILPIRPQFSAHLVDNVLVDLTAMRVTIRDPKAPRQFKPIHEVSDHEPSLVISTGKVVLGPFERTLVRAQVITQNPNFYRNVTIHPSGVHSRCPFVSENTLTSVGEGGTVFLNISSVLFLGRGCKGSTCRSLK